MFSSHHLTIALLTAPFPIEVSPEAACSPIAFFSVAEDTRRNEVVHVVSSSSTEWNTMINLPGAIRTQNAIIRECQFRTAVDTISFVLCINVLQCLFVI